MRRLFADFIFYDVEKDSCEIHFLIIKVTSLVGLFDRMLAILSLNIRRGFAGTEVKMKGLWNWLIENGL